jgi:hypothetical protein
MLVQSMRQLQTLSRAEAAEERAKEADQMNEAIRKQADLKAQEMYIQMEEQFEAKFNTEMAQAAATNERMQKDAFQALSDRDSTIARQRSEYRENFEAMQHQIARHAGEHENMKQELAAHHDKLRINENAERQRASIALTEAAERFKATEEQGYFQYKNEMHSAEEKFAEIAAKSEAAQREAMRKAVDNKNQQLMLELSENFNKAKTELTTQHLQEQTALRSMAETRHAKALQEYQEQSQLRELHMEQVMNELKEKSRNEAWATSQVEATAASRVSQLQCELMEAQLRQPSSSATPPRNENSLWNPVSPIPYKPEHRDLAPP